MKLVIDSNALQTEKLQTFLAKSTLNFAVLPDFVAIEAYKTGSLKAICKSMSIVSLFPNQVIILKGSSRVCGLSGRRKGLQRRLIDENQTSGFPAYVRALHQAEKGDNYIQEGIMEHSRFANEHMSKMLIVAESMRGPIEELGARFTKDERKKLSLHTDEDYPLELIHKVMQYVMEMTALSVRDSHLIQVPPRDHELPNTFIFRVMLASVLHCIRRSCQSAIGDLKVNKLRNDFVDMIIVAYGTYFDGIMSADKNVNYMFLKTKNILSRF